ncbi:MAG: isochorismatase family protein [Catenulispora sp.]
MALTALDATSALIVIDLQKGVVGFPTLVPAPEIIGRAAGLAREFRARKLPVVLVNAVGQPRPTGRTTVGMGKPQPPEWSELVPELDVQPDDILITKHQWGAFHGTALDLYLRRLGVTQLVFAGIATSLGVESTARAAFEHDYNLTFATDAMTDFSPDAQENSLKRIFPMLGELGTCEEIVALLGSGS